MQELPIGVSDFKALIEYKNPLTNKGYLYVDKTLFIREIIADSGTQVIVITRPRRFGKTINLSMLQYFFAATVNGQSTARLFDGLEISKHPDCMKLQGNYPVIFLSLKDTKADNFESAINKVYEQIRQLYEQHRYVIEGDKLSQQEKEGFVSILNETANIDKLSFALHNLTYCIHKTLGKKVYLFLDEYDTPIQAAYLNGYYEKFINFMRVLLGSALKGNINLQQAVLTGILRVSKESLFSDLNNVKIYSILNSKYSSCFGFTEDEVNGLITKAKLPIDAQKTKEWYNGYNFGGTTIYNPWSIVEFVKEQGQVMSYWVNTSGNEMVKNLIIKSDPAIKEIIEELLLGNNIQEYVDEHIVFGDLERNKSALWSLLLMSGYLKFTSKEPQGNYYLCTLAIPNKEIEYFYNNVIEKWLSGARGLSWYREFLDDLAYGRAEEFEEKLQTLIEESLSYHDVTKKSQEAFYHGLMLAFISGLKDTHEIKSNKESGKGRYDVALIPLELMSKKFNKNSNLPGVIMEFKATQDETKLTEVASEALDQIKKSNYVQELQSRGMQNICCMGIAFSGKAVKILSD